MGWIIVLRHWLLTFWLKISLLGTRKHNRVPQIYITRLNRLNLGHYHTNFENSSQTEYWIPIAFLWLLETLSFKPLKDQLRVSCHLSLGNHPCWRRWEVLPKMTKAPEKIPIPQENYPKMSSFKPLWYRCSNKSVRKWQNWQIEKWSSAVKQNQWLNWLHILSRLSKKRTSNWNKTKKS